MALLSRKVDYALLILAYLHHKPEGACARAIADCYSLSRAFVANILKDLCQRGFVTSHRGVKGGYTLQRPAADISLAEVLTALDESFRFAACNEVNPDEGCSLAQVCPIRGPVAQVHDRIRAVLHSVTLTELFPEEAPVERFPLELAEASAD